VADPVGRGDFNHLEDNMIRVLLKDADCEIVSTDLFNTYEEASEWVMVQDAEGYDFDVVEFSAVFFCQARNVRGAMALQERDEA
jgi:hypothetical protein